MVYSEAYLDQYDSWGYTIACQYGYIMGISLQLGQASNVFWEKVWLKM